MSIAPNTAGDRVPRMREAFSEEVTAACYLKDEQELLQKKRKDIPGHPRCTIPRHKTWDGNFKFGERNTIIKAPGAMRRV